MITICIPLHHKGGKLKDNSELRFVLRSFEANLQGEFEITIVGKKPPEWLQGVGFIESGGLKQAVRDAAEAFPGGFMWWYDDCVLLQKQTELQIKVTPAATKWGEGSVTPWGKKLLRVRNRLETEGLNSRDYSHAHGPYWFDRSMITESFEDWPKMKSKFPFESWILSKRNWPWRAGVTAQRYGAFGSPPAPDKVFLNFNEDGFTPEMIEWLEEKFPHPSRFENQGVPWESIRRPAPPKEAPLFFVHVPKNGGTSIRSALGFKVMHGGTSHFPASAPPATRFMDRRENGIIFGVVRNPYDRAWSIYRFFKKKKPGARGGTMDVAMEAFTQSLTVDAFWQEVDINRLMQACRHVRTQSSFLCHDRVRILRFESLTEDWNRLILDSGRDSIILPEVQRTPTTVGWEEALSLKTKKVISKIYAEDFRRFDYEP